MRKKLRAAYFGLAAAWLAIIIFAAAIASDNASWWFNSIPSTSHTMLSLVGLIFQVLRATCTVQTNSCSGISMSAMRQHACRTLRSNGALWATKYSASSMNSCISGQTSANTGPDFTLFHVSPWISVNSKCSKGGRIKRSSVRTIFPDSTRTRPIEHALFGYLFAVSKSMATKVSFNLFH